MKPVNVNDAQDHLSKWVDLAAQGEEIIICKDGIPAARLVAYQTDKTDKKPRLLGVWKNKVQIRDDFDELPNQFLNNFR